MYPAWTVSSEPVRQPVYERLPADARHAKGRPTWTANLDGEREMAGEETWFEVMAGVLKQHKIDLVTYVPDNVLRPLIDLVHEDPFFTAFAVAREEEGLGINAGAWMAGRRGILLMQTSGFATLPNALASLSVPFQIPSL